MRELGSIRRMLGVALVAALAGVAGARAHAQDAQAFGSYFYSGPLTTATLEVANPTDRARIVVPTVRAFGLRSIELEPVAVEPHGTVRVPLDGLLGAEEAAVLHEQAVARTAQDLYAWLAKDGMGILDSDPDRWHALLGRIDALAASSAPRWGDGSRPGSYWGSLTLRGNTEEVSAWVLSTSASESVGVNTVLHPSARAETSTLAWWRPTPDTSVRFALQNPNGVPVRVSVSAETGATAGALPFAIGAGETRLVSLEELMLDLRSSSAVEDAGSLALVTEPATGDRRVQGVVARAFLVDEGVGFSTPIAERIQDGDGSSAFQSPGGPIGEVGAAAGFPAGTTFSPHLVLGNRSASRSITVVPAVHGLAGADGSAPGVRPLPAIVLAPGEARVVDVLSELDPAAFLPGTGAAAVSHDGAPGELVAESVTVSVDAGQSHRFSFYDPMSAVPGTSGDELRALVVGISFDLTQDRNTLLVAKNTTDAAATFSYRIAHETGKYAVKDVELGPQELRVIDLKALRDGAVPDSYGVLLPADASFGHFILVSPPTVVFSDPTIDFASGTCNSCPYVTPLPKPKGRPLVKIQIMRI